MKKTFELTEKQKLAKTMIASHDRYKPLFFLLYGGSQSAKTSFACYYMTLSCVKYPETTGIICRKNFTDLKATIFQNTFPNMMRLRYGDEQCRKLNRYKQSPPLSCDFYNGSRIYFIGLEDNLNFEKILGRKISQFLIDEASEVGYQAFSKLTTRMSENTGARHIGFVTMNPTSVFSWCYRLFVERKNPKDDEPLRNPQFFKNLQMNPKDNLDNLPEGYVENLENLSDFDRLRFLTGEFGQAAENAVYAKQLKQAKEEGRITKLPAPDKHYPLHMAWDIGYDDYNSCWIYQILPARIMLYAYLEQQHTDLISFSNSCRDKIVELIGEGNWYTTLCHLPHDAEQHSRQTGLTDRQILINNNVAIPHQPISYPKPQIRPVQSGIMACRTMFGRCWFDAKQCELGLSRLASYVEVIEDGNDGFRQRPRHDKSSHAADSYRYAITSYYAQLPHMDGWRRDPNATYGADLMSPATRRLFGIW
jgi:PBSX family phage terminase large subunit